MSGYFAKPPFGATLNRGHRLARGLKSAWLFNDGSGTRFVEAVQNLPVVSATSPPTWTHGLYGHAIDCGAGGKHFETTMNTTSMPALSSDPWTIAALVYPTGVGASGSVALNFGEVGDSNWDYILGLNTASKVGCHGTTGTGFGAVSTTLTASSNAWHAIAVSQATRTSRTFFLDGVTEANTTDVGSNSVNATKKSSIGIGYINSSASAGLEWVGQIGAVFSWNRTLSNAELLEWYANPFGAFRRRRLPVPIHAAAAAVSRQQTLTLLGCGA